MIVARSAFPSDIVARMVVDDMPGGGVEWIRKHEQLEIRTPLLSVEQAVDAARALSGIDKPAVGVFRSGGAFQLFTLTAENRSFGGSATVWDDAGSFNYAARTNHGRGLVTVVDGDETVELMSAAAFRHYERWAGGESDA